MAGPLYDQSPTTMAEIGMGIDDVFDVRSRLGAVGVVFALVDDLDLVAAIDVLDRLGAAAWRCRPTSVPTNTAILPPLGRSFTISPPSTLARVVVVGADVEQAVRLGRVGVEGDEVGLLGQPC